MLGPGERKAPCSTFVDKFHSNFGEQQSYRAAKVIYSLIHHGTKLPFVILRQLCSRLKQVAQVCEALFTERTIWCDSFPEKVVKSKWLQVSFLVCLLKSFLEKRPFGDCGSSDINERSDNSDSRDRSDGINNANISDFSSYLGFEPLQDTVVLGEWGKFRNGKTYYLTKIFFSNHSH